MERHVYLHTVVSVDYHYKKTTKRVLVYYKADIIIISLNVTSSRYDVADKILISHLALNKNHSLTYFRSTKNVHHQRQEIK
jgi:hypothetical protein